MKILEIIELPMPEIKIIKYQRFTDHRGYFTETYRYSDIFINAKFIKGEFLQANESFSYANTLRGFHFQWNPFMGKLVRPLFGHLIDYAIDIRPNSANYGKIIGYDMPANRNSNYSEWIWVPPGFAHGTLLVEDSLIEYFCTGEYNQNCEAGITLNERHLDWSLCTAFTYRTFNKALQTSEFITEKDKNGWTLEDWLKNPNSKEFI